MQLPLKPNGLPNHGKLLENKPCYDIMVLWSKKKLLPYDIDDLIVNSLNKNSLSNKKLN